MWGPVRHGPRAAEGGDCVQVDISTRHGHLSDASRQKIEAKVMRITRIFERLTSIHLTIDLEHEEMPSVDLKVSAEHKHDFVSTDRGSRPDGFNRCRRPSNGKSASQVQRKN